MQTILITIVTSLALAGCATSRESMLLGGAIGASSGAFVGNNMSEHDPKSTAIGAITGAAFGALIGYFGHADKVKKDQEAAANRTKGYQPKRKIPNLNDAQVESLWIPAHIENDQYIDGHYIYVIRKNATWKQED